MTDMRTAQAVVEFPMLGGDSSTEIAQVVVEVPLFFGAEAEVSAMVVEIPMLLGDQLVREVVDFVGIYDPPPGWLIDRPEPDNPPYGPPCEVDGRSQFMVETGDNFLLESEFYFLLEEDPGA